MPSRMMAGVASSSSSVESPPSDTGSVSRHARNLAEKQRRDKLNGFINELATIVPMVSMMTKRLDKTSILRLSAAHLRIHQSPLNPKKFKKKFSWGPDIINSDHINELLKAVGGFLLIASHTGKILYVSSSVENFLGLQNIELIGYSLFSFVHPSDVEYVQEKLKTLASLSAQKKKQSVSARCTFSARMRERSQPRSETANHQLMQFCCSLDVDDDYGISQKSKSLNLKRNKSSCTDSLSGSILKAFIKPLSVNPLNELSVTEAFQDEYITRHGIDGKILYADHRISTITGHLPHEVHGMSAYEYICDTDIPVAIFAHNRMFSSSDGTGMIVYRLRTRNQTAVYLKSTGHLQYEKSSTQVHHFVCINKLLSEEEGEKELKKFIEQHTPHIHEKSAPTLHPLLSGLKPVEVSQIFQTIPSEETLPSTSQQFLSLTQSTPNTMTNSSSPSCSHASSPPAVSSPVNFLPPQPRNSPTEYQNDEVECISTSHVAFGSETSHSPNEIYDRNNTHFNYLALNAPVGEEHISECCSNGFINGYSTQTSSENFDQRSLSDVHNAHVDTLITFPTPQNGRKRLADDFPRSLNSLQEIGMSRDLKRKHQRLNPQQRRLESGMFSISLACHEKGTLDVNEPSSSRNGFIVPHFEKDSLPKVLYDPGIQVSEMYKTNQNGIYPDVSTEEYHKNSPDLMSEKELSRVFDNLTDYKTSEDISVGWYPYKSSSTYSSLQEVNKTLTTPGNSCIMPSSRYSAENNSNLQSFGVNGSQEWLDGPCDGLNIATGK